MSFNRYLYVNNNPYKYTDPNGEFLNFVVGAVGGFIAEVGTQLITDGTVTSWNKVGVSTVTGALTSGYSVAGQGLKLGTAAFAANATMDGLAGTAGSLIADGLDGNIEGSFERAGQAFIDSAIGPGKQAMTAGKGVLKEAGVVKDAVRESFAEKATGAVKDSVEKGVTGAAANMINKVDDEKH
jgi:uncharacterized membrane protein YeaQ/YmgE (transglycosylase-associated protein family)